MLEKVAGDDELRRQAAEAALAAVEPGMKLGLGTGRTAEHFVRLLSARVKAGFEVVGVPTSERTADLARQGGIPLATLDDGSRATWKSLNIVLPALLVLGYGLLQWKMESIRTKRLEELYG